MSVSLPLVKPQTLRSRVEDSLRQAIARGKLKAGETLIEREPCETRGISRPSLQEALRRLEAETLIVIVPHRGPEVASTPRQEARDICALLLCLQNRDARGAQKVSRQHVLNARRAALGIFKQAGLDNSDPSSPPESSTHQPTTTGAIQ
jgi:DNA-binding GntR family transcriptional regulator